MISIRKINAIVKKQIRDTLKNKSVLIQFLMFPLLTIVMTNGIQIKDMSGDFFVTLFATMYIGMAPLTSMSSIISEEKEGNTLRMLLMSNMKAVEYLFGVGIYVVSLCLVGACVIGSQGNYSGAEFAKFVGIMFIGIVSATVIGAVIGVCSKNQMSATSITVPIMMVFSFLPMIASFNDNVKKVSNYIFSQQISNMIEKISANSISGQSIIIICCNVAIAVVAFIVAYRKFGLAS